MHAKKVVCSYKGLLGELDLTKTLASADHVLVLDTHFTTTPKKFITHANATSVQDLQFPIYTADICAEHINIKGGIVCLVHVPPN